MRIGRDVQRPAQSRAGVRLPDLRAIFPARERRSGAADADGGFAPKFVPYPSGEDHRQAQASQRLFQSEACAESGTQAGGGVVTEDGIGWPVAVAGDADGEGVELGALPGG